MAEAHGDPFNSNDSTTAPKKNTGRTFRDGIRKIDLIIVVKDEENIISDSLKHNFFTNVVKMGFEIEPEYGVLPIHKKLIFFKVHCPNDVLNNLGNAFGVKCVQSARGERIMTRNECEWINLVRKEYPQPLQYSSLDRSLVVYMAMLNLPFGDRQNYIGLKRLMQRNIVIDAYGLHDGPYFISQDVSHINARQILFYNWVGIKNVLKRQPINLIYEYFGPKIAFYFAFYGLYNLALAIATIVALITLFLAVFKNHNYTSLIDPLCDRSKSIMICLGCTLSNDNYYCFQLETHKLCNWYKMYVLTDNKYTPYCSAFMILWGIFFTAYWFGREKYMRWIWETQNKEYNRKQTSTALDTDVFVNNSKRKPPDNDGVTFKKLECLEDRPEFDVNFMNASKSKTTGITLLGIPLLTKIKILICYIVVILLGVAVCLAIYSQRHILVKDNITNVDRRDRYPEKKTLQMLYILIVFVIVLFFLDQVNRLLAHYIVEKENHRTYQAYSQALAKHLYIMCFPLPVIVLVYYGVYGTNFAVSQVYDHKIYAFHNTCLMTSCFFELSIALTVVLLIRYTIFRKFSLYSSLTDYNQRRSRVENVPCWEREYVLPQFKEDFLIYKMKLLVIQFTLIIMFAYSFPPVILIVLFFNICDMRRDTELVTLHYRRPLLLKDKAFNIWSKILKLMVYLAIILNVLTFISSTENIEIYLRERKIETGPTLDKYFGLLFHELYAENAFYCYARGYMHIGNSIRGIGQKNRAKVKKNLTMDELRTYQYMYFFIFEIVMAAIFMISQYLFSIDVDELEIPKKPVRKNDMKENL